MSSPSFTFRQDASTALLALKRFVRGTLKPLGMGLLSLMLILRMSPHLPAAAALPETIFPEAIFPEATLPEAIADTTQPSIPVPAQSLGLSGQNSRQQQGPSQTTQSDPVRSVAMPSHLLQAQMTHHYLTGARLSIPETIHSEGASLGGSR